MTSLITAAVVFPAVPFLFPGKRQLLPRGMAEWEPRAEDDGDLDDLPVDERAERESAAGGG
jgi:hypothetical protein